MSDYWVSGLWVYQWFPTTVPGTVQAPDFECKTIRKSDHLQSNLILTIQKNGHVRFSVERCIVLQKINFTNILSVSCVLFFKICEIYCAPKTFNLINYHYRGIQNPNASCPKSFTFTSMSFEWSGICMAGLTVL